MDRRFARRPATRRSSCLPDAVAPALRPGRRGADHERQLRRDRWRLWPPWAAGQHPTIGNGPPDRLIRAVCDLGHPTDHVVHSSVASFVASAGEISSAGVRDAMVRSRCGFAYREEAFGQTTSQKSRSGRQEVADPGARQASSAGAVPMPAVAV